MHPIVQSRRQVGRQLQVMHMEILLAGITGHDQRAISDAEIGWANTEDVDVAPASIHTGDTGRQPVPLPRPQHFRDNGGHGRRIVDELSGRGRNAPRHEPLVSAAMIGKVVAHRPDNGELVRNFSLSWKKFAGLDARVICGHRPKVTAILDRHLRLHFVGVEVSRATGQPDEDDCVVSHLSS